MKNALWSAFCTVFDTFAVYFSDFWNLCRVWKIHPKSKSYMCVLRVFLFWRRKLTITPKMVWQTSVFLLDERVNLRTIMLSYYECKQKRSKSKNVLLNSACFFIETVRESVKNKTTKQHIFWFPCEIRE
jgi:hypothetical protein